jgi:RNA polymerase sigma factor (sigma-70 family)
MASAASDGPDPEQLLRRARAGDAAARGPLLELYRNYLALLARVQRAARREQAVLLADALERLPADYREVIILRYLEGLAPPEVAWRMGRSVESVRKLWTRALVQLRRALGDVP